MELNVIVREYDPKTEKWTTLYDQTKPVEAGMTRNHALRWMLADVAECLPDERKDHLNG